MGQGEEIQRLAGIAAGAGTAHSDWELRGEAAEVLAGFLWVCQTYDIQPDDMELVELVGLINRAQKAARRRQDRGR